jgi:hypothetical protein
MRKSKSLFSQLHKKAVFYGLVDKGGWFPQMLASRKTTAEYTKLTKISALSVVKNSVNLCESVKSVVNFSSCLSAFVAEIRSIKIERLCETKPISEMPKMVITTVYTMTNNKKQRTMNYQKQSQTNPTCGERSRIHLWCLPCEAPSCGAK